MKLNIGYNIRTLRRAADMTQDELAVKLGVTFQTVSRWENGGSYPDIELLPVLADIFGVTTDHLLGNDVE
ncbi:MAG: helix-turn-helix transcriptional regulator, partial [Clostridia bacterium]|nr:helix-turn-helix transcriptional regulator [Clostridia bacterium]